MEKKYDTQSSHPADEITRIIDALMDEDIDPRIKERMQQWFRSEIDSEKKQEAFVKYADKMEPYTGKLKGDALLRYNKLATRLGLKPVAAPRRKLLNRRIAWRVAAVLVPVMIVMGTWVFMTLQPESPELRIASADHTQTAFMPDSSFVSVSPGSTVYYHESDDVREVDLSGEAFFKVHRDENRPFSVSTLDLKVSVLGTEFSVHDFPADNLGEVSLYSGSVSVEAGTSANVLSRGERLRYDALTNEITISIIPASEMIEKGYKPRLKFNHASFGEVVTALSAYYDIEIQIPAGMENSYDLTVDLDGESLERSLNLLVKMDKEPLTYTMQNSKVVITK